jgi:acyl carrier protein
MEIISEDLGMRSVIEAYVSRELVTKPEALPLSAGTPLIGSGILDSLSLLKLVLFLEQRFQILVGAEDLIPENFATIDAVCEFVSSRQSRL